jgi:hypothetical protein
VVNSGATEIVPQMKMMVVSHVTILKHKAIDADEEMESWAIRNLFFVCHSPAFHSL